jgi:putative transposase
MQIHSDSGVIKEKLKPLEVKDLKRIDTTISNLSLKKEDSKKIILSQNYQKQDEKSAIVESQQEVRKMTSNDKNNTLKKNIQPTESLKILDQALTSRGKALEPFWTTHVEENSKNLWLPTKTDCVDLDLTSSNTLLKNIPMEESLLSMTVQVQKTKNLSKTSSQSLQSFLPELTDSENTSQAARQNSLKMMKIRFRPSLKQKNLLNKWFGVYRYFYNEAKIYSINNKTYSFKNIRNALRGGSKYNIPKKWNPELIPDRIMTGAIKDYCSNFKTCMTLLKTGQIKHFEIHEKRKKHRTQTLNLEKCCFSKKGNVLFSKLPIDDSDKGLKINGIYKYRTKRKKKKKIEFKDILIKHDCRISYQNEKFYILVPYKKKEEIQKPEHDIISIDSGIRTFQTGYCPEGHTVEISKDPTSKLNCFYEKLDVLNQKYFDTRKNGTFLKEFKHKRSVISRNRKRVFEKIKNKVDDMHWKTILFLTRNYKNIVISDFQTKSLLRLKELRKISKRTLTALSHYKFRMKLKEKCQSRGNHLFFIDESFTSKTCGRCGRLNQSLGANKTFKCPFCSYKSDRDVNAGRNILLKAFELTTP